MTGYIATCENCGAGLMYPVEWRGHTYGRDCVEIVTGVRFEDWNTRREAGRVVLDEAATAARRAERDSKIAAERARQAEVAACATVRAGRDAWLAEALESESGTFCASIARDLRAGFGAESFSDKVRGIVCDIIGRQAGRRNSKKYWDAYERVAEALNATTTE